jgi:hypothetical protein
MLVAAVAASAKSCRRTSSNVFASCPDPSACLSRLSPYVWAGPIGCCLFSTRPSLELFSSAKCCCGQFFPEISTCRFDNGC